MGTYVWVPARTQTAGLARGGAGRGPLRLPGVIDRSPELRAAENPVTYHVGNDGYRAPA